MVQSVVSVLSLEGENYSSSSGISQNLDPTSSLIEYLKGDNLEKKKKASSLLSEEEIKEQMVGTKQLDDIDINFAVEKMKSLMCKWKKF